MINLGRDTTYESWDSYPPDGIEQVLKRLKKLQECLYNTSPTRYSAIDPDTATTKTAPTDTPVKDTTKGTATGRSDDGSTINKSTTTDRNILPLTEGNVGLHNRNQERKIKRSKSAPDLGNI